MKPVKYFERFIEEGIVKRQNPDKSRAQFLINEAEKEFNNLLKQIKIIKIDDDNANNCIKTGHDILMELIRANMLLEGFNASGFHAHEAEVSYLRALGFKETDVQFVDQIRYFRNGMLYYGTILDKEYAEKVIEFVNKIYPKIKGMIKI